MQARIEQKDIYRMQPALAKALLGLGGAAAATLEPALIHLVKLRVSQINGCAFCQHMHAGEARADGERQPRLDVLPGWREAPCFSERERAALAWAEAVTELARGPVSDELFKQVREHFSEAELVDLTCAVIAINGWNRIAAPFHFVPDMT